MSPFQETPAQEKRHTPPAEDMPEPNTMQQSLKH